MVFFQMKWFCSLDYLGDKTNNSTTSMQFFPFSISKEEKITDFSFFSLFTYTFTDVYEVFFFLAFMRPEKKQLECPNEIKLIWNWIWMVVQKKDSSLRSLNKLSQPIGCVDSLMIAQSKGGFDVIHDISSLNSHSSLNLFNFGQQKNAYAIWKQILSKHSHKNVGVERQIDGHTKWLWAKEWK